MAAPLRSRGRNRDGDPAGGDGRREQRLALRERARSPPPTSATYDRLDHCRREAWMSTALRQEPVDQPRLDVAASIGHPQRRALRAAIAATVCFYLGWIAIGDRELAVFATLGVIGLLVMADFGGSLDHQARAYALATVIAAALVALGTVVSAHTWAAAGLLFVVALCVSLSTVMGRNVATGANGVDRKSTR